MDLTLYQPSQTGTGLHAPLRVVANNVPAERKPFIEANTIASTLTDIRNNHIIPVFHKDNEPVISQVDFIEATQEAVHQHFSAERILSPLIRLSNPIKGRIPEARNKPASELQEWEKTVYYERMAFIIEVPTISDTIGGEPLCLTIGGVKAYNLDNLYNRKGADEHFKLFIGFRVSVCTNLCVWTDGMASNIKVKSLQRLQQAITDLIENYDAIADLSRLSRLEGYSLTEKQFAQLIGRCRLYQHMPADYRKGIPELPFGDNQINGVCRDYYRDQSFSREDDGSINLWRLYNLFTAANKASYIDSFLERGAGSTGLVDSLASALENKRDHWFLS